MRASGHLSNPSLGVDRLFETDRAGVAAVSGLPLGRYRLEVSREGFVTHAGWIDITADRVSRVITLAIGQALSRVEVVAATPLPGIDQPREQIASPIQMASQRDIEHSGAIELGDFLNRRFNGIYINEMQGNPFQVDLNYRGFTASPLLGTPQGISVYMDGVRQNQPFGDIVGWDLIPRNAISSVTLMPGSNPLFGLNTLGGAISIQTKDGARSPGTLGRIGYGSNGRKTLQLEHGGGKAEGFNWFLAANVFHESGWRVASPSDTRQGFARLGWHRGNTTANLTAAYAHNTLKGLGLQDYRLLAANWSSIYTAPDIFNNRSPSVNFSARHNLTNAVSVSVTAWHRNIRTESLNGNLNTQSLDQSVYQPSAADIAALRAAGYSGYPTSGANSANTPFPRWRCIAQALQFDEALEKCNAIIVHGRSVQRDYGISAQVTRYTSARGHRNQFTAGGGYGRGVTGYTQNTQFGYLNPDRSITGIASWQDGSTNSNGEPVDTRVNLHGIVPNKSLYATDTLSVGNALHFTLSGRYNHNTIDNRDRLKPQPGLGTLNGFHTYGRFNGSAGVTYNPVAAVNVYASYAEGSRAPTSIELGCADPLNPCILPNALASDPPLKQVVTGTWESGLRGKTESGLNWSSGLFRAENRNDILFVSSPRTGAGYFKNFGKTRRQGFQASADGKVREFRAGLDYTFLDATYQTNEVLNGFSNSSNSTARTGAPGLDGVIPIAPGNRIAMTPNHIGKAWVEWAASKRLLLDGGLIATSSSLARGNENGGFKADGKYYLGQGTSPGYAVMNVGARFDLMSRMQIAAQIDNLFDKRYYSAAQLEPTGLTPQGNFIARPFPAYTAGPQAGNYPIQHSTFVAPGAPRRFLIELRVRF